MLKKRSAVFQIELGGGAKEVEEKIVDKLEPRDFSFCLILLTLINTVQTKAVDSEHLMRVTVH